MNISLFLSLYRDIDVGTIFSTYIEKLPFVRKTALVYCAGNVAVACRCLGSVFLHFLKKQSYGYIVLPGIR